MKRESAERLVYGDHVYAIPMWNQTSPPKRQLPEPATVLDVSIVSGSESGILIDVRTNGGEIVSLDAGWFEEPANTTRPTPEAKHADQ